MDYDAKIESYQVKFIFVVYFDHLIFQIQLSDEKTRNTTLQRQELEHKKDIERLQEKSAKFEDETIQGQYTIETLSREIHDKVIIYSIFKLGNHKASSGLKITSSESNAFVYLNPIAMP